MKTRRKWIVGSGVLAALAGMIIASSLRTSADPNHPGPVLTISLPSTTFTNDEPINAKLLVENKHSTAIALVRGELDSGIWVGGWRPYITGTNGCYGYTLKRGGNNLVMILDPHKTYTTEINLGDAHLYSPNKRDKTKRVRLTQGKYRAQIKYAFSEDHEYAIIRPVWYGTTESNEVEFEVR